MARSAGRVVTREEERRKLEEIAGDIGRVIKAALEDARKAHGLERPIGFALVVSDFGGEGSLAYAASVTRSSAVSLLRETADVLAVACQ